MSMTTIQRIDPTDKRQREAFLRLPFSIYKHNLHWVPPLAMDARRQLDPRRNAFFQHGDAAFYLAQDPAGQPLARLAVLENQAYNTFNATREGFFYLFECVDDPAVARRLFEAGFEWARARGLDCVSGPKGFSLLDGMGLLVKGFEYRPALGLPYNPPYYAALIEEAGFQATGEVVSGRLDRSFHMPEKVAEVARRVAERKGIQIERVRSRRELARVIPQLRELYNLAIEGTSGNYPLSDADLKSMADQLLWFADPRLIKILTKDGEAIGFLLAYPDISAAIQRSRGRLFPFGWLDALIERQRTTLININGAGIAEQYRGMGGTAILFNEMYLSVVESKRYVEADIVQIGVENDKMQRELRSLGIDFHKTHRMYSRSLAG